MPSGSMKSVDTRRFAMVPRNDVPRSAFDVNHIHKTTFGAGFLIPLYVQEVLPGDTIRCKMTAFARLAPVIVPVMDNLILESFFFFVPNRILWTNWKRFMGELDSPTDTTIFLTPYTVCPFSQCAPGQLADYMGITMNGAGVGDIAVSAFPFRAYNLIWNEWFRDQDLQTRLTVHVDDGPDPFTPTYSIPSFRGKRHDYFTTARPWPLKPTNQEQFPGVLGGTNVAGGPFFQNGQKIGAPVTGIGKIVGSSTFGGPGVFTEAGARDQTYPFYYKTSTADKINIRAITADGPPDIKVLINDIRTANSVQRLFEKNARGGTRYTEIVRSHFGVVSPDARLQRPEYLGGGRSFINMHPVAQTSESTVDGVLGEQAAIGTASVYDHGFSSSFTEHGIILGMINVRADLSYQQGIRRMWFRRTQFDFYWPSLAHLGEQGIMSKEIFCDGTAGDTTLFGYQERWSEYKYQPSRISGAFRSSYATPLDMWHFSQQFAARPTLGATFIAEDPPVERALQVASLLGQQFLIDALFEERMVRCMPMYSIPGLGDRM